MSESELLEKARQIKETGNDHFRKKEFKEAAKCYTKSHTYKLGVGTYTWRNPYVPLS